MLETAGKITFSHHRWSAMIAGMRFMGHRKSTNEIYTAFDGVINNHQKFLYKQNNYEINNFMLFL